jgi:hypothetical protein
MKIVIFHYGWLKKAEIPNGATRVGKQRANLPKLGRLKVQGVSLWKESKGMQGGLFTFTVLILYFEFDCADQFGYYLDRSTHQHHEAKKIIPLVRVTLINKIRVGR